MKANTIYMNDTIINLNTPGAAMSMYISNLEVRRVHGITFSKYVSVVTFSMYIASSQLL